jgi:hypothetical protein
VGEVKFKEGVVVKDVLNDMADLAAQMEHSQILRVVTL